MGTITEAARNELVERIVESCQRFAAQEIQRHQMDGEFDTGFVEPMDVVDDVLSEKLPDLDDSAGYSRLCLIVQGRIAERLQTLGREATRDGMSSLSLEDSPPPDSAMPRIKHPPSLDGRIVPDPEMHLEDTLGDSEHDSPEGLAADRELRELLVGRLYGLPRELRELFSAVVIDGWPAEEIAAARDESPDYVRAAVARALVELSQSLTAAGTVYSNDRVRELYEEMSEDLTRTPHPHEHRDL